MTFAQIITTCLARMGDISFRELGTTAVESGETTVANLLDVKAEIQRAYETIVNTMDEHDFQCIITNEDLTYTVGQQTKDLRTELADEPRIVTMVAWYPDNDTSKEPTRVVMPHQGAYQYATQRRYPFDGWARRDNQRPWMFHRGYELSFISPVQQTRIIRVSYSPVLPTLTNDADIPEHVPTQFHQAIATLAAIKLLGGEDGPQSKVLGGMQVEWEQIVRFCGKGLNRHGKPTVMGAWKEWY